MSDDISPSCRDGMNMLGNMSLQGYAAPQIIRIGQAWVDRHAPGADPLINAGTIAIAALIREAYDQSGLAYARRVANLFATCVKEELDFARLRDRTDREQATGSKTKKRKARAA
ncbi:hypothetical protein J2D73_19580 [Acetobacter sacchari]|uniref:Glutaminase n=1 Tax=Acetobacter sacchari TaxID=2661687 RepID=A0ABS3M1C4_9PROT|nr:hypothetical protein [Acetobacter sacchari]MBO1361987.1 hypothetical protein [Acetobacter sacchari]